MHLEPGVKGVSGDEEHESRVECAHPGSEIGLGNGA
jgi:hypothetical protein